jgi:transcriptional regulator with XRE-family HTH domain
MLFLFTKLNTRVQSMDTEIGTRLKRLREQRGLSQRALARQAGVANATISQIESGKLNPTVSMLKKVLDGVPVKLSEFFADGDERPDRVIFRAGELTEITEGGVSYRQVGANLAGRQIQFLRERYAPGTDTGRHALVHDGEECGMIISGRLQVVVDGRSSVLHPGDAYYFSSRRPHQFRNPGPEPCEVISACTPPSF